jgi:hypothetical protein
MNDSVFLSCSANIHVTNIRVSVKRLTSLLLFTLFMKYIKNSRGRLIFKNAVTIVE